MKTFQNTAFQGDVMLRRVDEIPSGFFAGAPGAERHVIAHSETGHNHDVDACGVTLFTGRDPMVCYLRMDTVESFDVIHHRAFDTHETVRALGEPGAVFEVRRQREHTPDGWRRVED